MEYSSNRGDPMATIFTIAFVVIIFIVSLVRLNIQDRKKRKREEKFKNFVKRTGAITKTYFGEPIKKYKDVMNCFMGMVDPVFYNVIVKEDKENGNVYVGELQWDRPARPRSRGRYNTPDYSGCMGVDAKFDKLKNYTTMCVFIDDGFNLPNFDLIKETLDKKAGEFLRMNDTVDIDFDEDKKFSEAWWLSSNENMIVKELFNYNVRTNFMKFVDKGYRISGHENTLIILADYLYEPEEYVRLISDIKAISKFLKTNKKFYKSKEGRENSSEVVL